jgi:hypothetical protein
MLFDGSDTLLQPLYPFLNLAIGDVDKRAFLGIALQGRIYPWYDADRDATEILCEHVVVRNPSARTPECRLESMISSRRVSMAAAMSWLICASDSWSMISGRPAKSRDRGKRSQ